MKLLYPVLKQVPSHLNHPNELAWRINNICNHWSQVLKDTAHVDSK
ncbi:hypothetical protein [Bacteriophage sp.]|nr:hypothetical protein [Bacteriophage sp.]